MTPLQTLRREEGYTEEDVEREMEADARLLNAVVAIDPRQRYAELEADINRSLKQHQARRDELYRRANP